MLIAKTNKTNEEILNILNTYNYFLNNSSAFLVILNLNGYAEVISPSFLNLTGYTEKELSDVKFYDFLHPEDSHTTLKEIEALNPIKQTVNYINRFRKKDGNYIWLDWNASTDLVSGKIYSIARDISLHKLKEFELEKNQLRQLGLLKTLDAGVVIHAPDTSIKESNPKAGEILGLSEEQMRGKLAIDPEWKFLNEDKTPLLLINYPVNEIRLSKKKLKNKLLGINRPNSKDIIWVIVNGFPVLTKENEISEIVISFTDVTEQKKAEDELKISLKKTEENEQHLILKNKEFEEINKKLNQTIQDLQKANQEIGDRIKKETELLMQTEMLGHINKELEEFSYIASHDLQEPLRTILNYIGLLEEELSGKIGAEGDQYIKFINEATKRMQQLIKDLLELSRVGRNIKFEPVDCNKIMKEIVNDLALSIKDSNAKINLAELPIIKGNELEIKQVFQNLISNAIKFRDKIKQCIIDIKADEKDKEFVFSIKDNGIGIEDQFKDKLFIIFQRLHSTDEYPGTGIGLAICKKIVNKHGGKIWFESKPQEGTTFYFTIAKTN